jgi:sortase A
MRARTLEKASWIVGGLLLAFYVAAQAWIGQAGESALREFSQVRREQTEGMQQAQGNVLRFQIPDTGDWAAGRIAAHGAALDGALAQAVLRIATLDLEVPVYDGVTEWNLNRGAARIEGTATFDERGNVGLAAHRDGYFRALQDIRKGDLVEVLTRSERLQYRVTDIRIVSPQVIEVLAPTQAPALTLVTCYPFRQVGPSPQRFIVRATGLP